MKTAILDLLDALFTGNERILDLLEILIEDNSRFFACLFELILLAVLILVVHLKSQAAVQEQTNAAAAQQPIAPVVVQATLPPPAPAPAPILPLWVKCAAGWFLLLLFIGLLPG